MGILLCVTLQAAIHLGKDYTEDVRSTKNPSKKSLRLLFQVTRKLITAQTEITGITTIDWQQLRWRETTLLTDKAVQFETAKTCVFSDSVLCLGGTSLEQVQAWTDKIKWFWKHIILKNWIESTGNKWNSNENYYNNSLH